MAAPAIVITIEIGSRGLVAPETKQDVHNIFRLLGYTKDARSQAERCSAEARHRAMLGSYLVWCCRDREEWDLHETIGGWRGQTEPDNLTAADRTRQRDEQEKETAEGLSLIHI